VGIGRVGVALSITVLGCDGSYPGPGGACSGYLVRGAGTTVWVDAGSGTLANLQRHVEMESLDAVVLTHEHPDHCSDIDPFAVAMMYVRGGGPVPMYAPAGLGSHLYFGSSPALAWHDVTNGDRVEIGGLALHFSRTDHGPETLALRIDGDGSSLGYSADSGPAWSLEALGPGLELAVCEATYLKDDEGRAQHMSARQAGTSGRQSGVKRLVLTHRWPGVAAEATGDEGSTAFGSEVELAHSGAEYQA
jgi:ribonuclease BN (tRNA processing enzyme)